MAVFEKFSGKLLKEEGGFVNNPNDKGGATKYGITIDTWKTYGYDENKDGKIDDGDLKIITPADALAITKKVFWDYFKADEIKNQSIAEFIADWGYNSGRTTVARRVQRILNLTIDGVFGDETIKAINKANQAKLFEAVKADRKSFIEAIVRRDPTQKVFYNGWMNRINGFFFLQAVNGL